MKTFATTILIALTAISISAQNITGKVIDVQNQPVEFANVALYSLPDSTLSTGTATNQNGEFTLVSSGINGYLEISFIGYETKKVSATTEQTITLKDDSNLLDEVVIKGS